MTEPSAEGNTALQRAVNGDSVQASPRLLTVSCDDASRDAWDAYVGRASGAELYHDYRWRGLIAELFGHQACYLLVREGSTVRGVLPLVRLRSRVFGDFMVSVPYVNYGGVLADSPAARSALLEEAKRRASDLGVRHIELRHRAEPALDWPAREDKVAMVLDLPENEDALWKRFTAKLRSQIRRPEKEGAVVRQGGPELVSEFYSVFARNMRDLGTPVYPERFFRAIVATFAQEAKVFVVDLDGKPAAAGIVLAHRDTVEIPWASSLREANKAGVNMLLYWSVLRDAVGRGFRRFDFGRSTKDSGTHKFKAQWGAQAEQLRWHYWLADGKSLPKLNPTNPKYRMAIACWKRLPLPVANFIGPHIVKNLP